MCDAVIIGAGHNGLVCAFYLARAGLKVRMLERRHIVGGAAVTEEFYPGFRNSVASYTVSLLQPKIIRDMKLIERGLRIIERPISNFLPQENGGYLKLGGGLERTQTEFRRFSKTDADALPAYYDALETVADVLRALALKTPPNIGGGVRMLLSAALQGKRFASLKLSQQRDLLDLFTKSARSFLDGWFENDAIKAAFGFDAVVGNYASPDTPGSAYVLLHHVFGEVNGKKGAWGHAVGGMGAITTAMRDACIDIGVDITTDAAVRKVLVDHGRAVGVMLDSGARVIGKAIVANVGPKLLYDRLMDTEDLPEEFRRHARGFKVGSGTFRMNVALSELPRFTCLPESGEHHQSGIIIAPTLNYMDQAYVDARTFGWSKKPIVEMLIPSTLDNSLAPEGQHVASLFCQQFAPKLPEGRSWHHEREQAADCIIDTVNNYAPNFKASVLGRMILSPQDLEDTFGLMGGDIMHGHMSLDQLWAARPFLGHGDYRGPLKGLYMCGAGTHPGGGVTGAPGHNAAREILADRGFVKRLLHK
jgi:phytoene dehydrogenase-like protein